MLPPQWHALLGGGRGHWMESLWVSPLLCLLSPVFSPKGFCCCCCFLPPTVFLRSLSLGVSLFLFSLCCFKTHQAFVCSLGCCPVACLCSPSWTAGCNLGCFSAVFPCLFGSRFPLVDSREIQSPHPVMLLFQLSALTVPVPVLSVTPAFRGWPICHPLSEFSS